MAAKPQAHQLYCLTVQGVTVTLEGPPDVVAMYRTIRRHYPAEVSVEIASLGDESVLRQPSFGMAPKKVHSHHGHH
jgi:hypothetical protein